MPIASTSSHKVDNKDKGIEEGGSLIVNLWLDKGWIIWRYSYYLAEKKNEREKLFDDGPEIKPRLRTREEIIAKYRKAGVIYQSFGLSYLYHQVGAF